MAAFEVLFVTLLVTLLSAGLCLCYAIGADASARGSNGVAWGLGSFVFPPIAVVYVVYRMRLPARTKPAASGERWIGSFGIGGVSANSIATMVAPPDPVSTGLLSLLLMCVFVPTVALCWVRLWS